MSVLQKFKYVYFQLVLNQEFCQIKLFQWFFGAKKIKNTLLPLKKCSQVSMQNVTEGFVCFLLYHSKCVCQS